MMKILLNMKVFLEPIAQIECLLSQKWASAAHKRLLFVQWSLPPGPEHFDHHIDLFYQWIQTRNSLWLERGVFGSLALKGEKVLELACGDGFNAKNFYSLRSDSVVACDFDKTAIAVAKSKNSTKNVQFVLADIRTSMPGVGGDFANIIWDAAIEHFTEKEIDQLLLDIKYRLSTDGVLSGYTIVERDDGVKHIHQHEYEFRNKEDLLQFLAPHFLNVRVFETKYPTRHNLYFWASDGVLPFDDEWPFAIKK